MRIKGAAKLAFSLFDQKVIAVTMSLLKCLHFYSCVACSVYCAHTTACFQTIYANVCFWCCWAGEEVPTLNGPGTT